MALAENLDNHIWEPLDPAEFAKIDGSVPLAGERPPTKTALEEKRSGSELQFLHARHREIIRLHTMGMRNIQIAEYLGCSVSMVSNCLNSEIAKGEARRISLARDINAARIQADIADLTPKCVDLLHAVLDGKDKEGNPVEASIKHKMDAARFGLEINGLGAIKRTVNVDVPLAGGVLEEIRARAKAAGILAPSAVTDAEPIETPVETAAPEAREARATSEPVTSNPIPLSV